MKKLNNTNGGNKEGNMKEEIKETKEMRGERQGICKHKTTFKGKKNT